MTLKGTTQSKTQIQSGGTQARFTADSATRTKSHNQRFTNRGDVKQKTSKNERFMDINEATAR